MGREGEIKQIKKKKRRKNRIHYFLCIFMLPFYGHRAIFARSAFIAIVDTYAFKVFEYDR